KISKKAREFLLNAINGENLITVKKGDYNHVDLDDRSVIYLNCMETENYINGVSPDLNPGTSGYAIDFIHELGHSVGGVNTDDEQVIIEFTNMIRSELGKDYGQEQRHSYYLIESDPGHAYLPYSPEAKAMLEEGYKPYKQYIRIPIQ